MCWYTQAMFTAEQVCHRRFLSHLFVCIARSVFNQHLYVLWHIVIVQIFWFTMVFHLFTKHRKRAQGWYAAFGSIGFLWWDLPTRSDRHPIDASRSLKVHMQVLYIVEPSNLYIYIWLYVVYVYIYIYIYVCFCHTAGPQIFVYLWTTFVWLNLAGSAS